MERIKANEIVQYQFYAIPKAFFTEEKYLKLSLESKIIYSFLLDRLTLSQKNSWYDEGENVFLIYKRSDIAEKLCLSEKTVTKAINELKTSELLEEKRQGLGKPNLMFLGKLNLEKQDSLNFRIKNSKFYGSENEKKSVHERKNRSFRCRK